MPRVHEPQAGAESSALQPPARTCIDGAVTVKPRKMFCRPKSVPGRSPNRFLRVKTTNQRPQQRVRTLYTQHTQPLDHHERIMCTTRQIGNASIDSPSVGEAAHAFACVHSSTEYEHMHVRAEEIDRCFYPCYRRPYAIASDLENILL